MISLIGFAQSSVPQSGRVQSGDDLLHRRAMWFVGAFQFHVGLGIDRTALGQKSFQSGAHVAVLQERSGLALFNPSQQYLDRRVEPDGEGGVTHRGPYKDGPGELNLPIALDGMVVEPGDLIVGDDDGVLCIPFDQVDAVYKAAKAKNDVEQRSMEAVLKGTSDRSWVLAALKKGGCEFES